MRPAGVVADKNCLIAPSVVAANRGRRSAHRVCDSAHPGGPRDDLPLAGKAPGHAGMELARRLVCWDGRGVRGGVSTRPQRLFWRFAVAPREWLPSCFHSSPFW